MASEMGDENGMIFMCNNCLRELKLFEVDGTPDAVVRSFLTECKHVLCQMCCDKCKDKCAACGKNTRFLKISQNMPDMYKIWFTPISTLQQSIDDVINFHQDQDELTQARLVKKWKQREQQMERDLNDAKIEAIKMKIIYNKIHAEKK